MNFSNEAAKKFLNIIKVKKLKTKEKKDTKRVFTYK